MIDKGILTQIGQTPIVELSRYPNLGHLKVFAKLEMFNPGGSIKDRTAINLVLQAVGRGEVRPKKTTIIESSSGNLGIGLAQVCNYLGIEFVCVVDPLTTDQHIQLLKAYGARIDRVTQKDESGQYLSARIARVKYLLSSIKGSYWTNQYGNLDNPLAHQKTMQDIIDRLGPNIDYLFCAVSSCGTLRGCAESIKNNKLQSKVIAVDAEGSGIFGDKNKRRLIPGHGASIVPDIYQKGLEADFVLVSDEDCVIGCHDLLKYESILAGGSSGGVMSALNKMAPVIPEGAICAAILCDRGERYLNTIYSEKWIANHFPKLSKERDFSNF